jgi:hypothetical protein
MQRRDDLIVDDAGEVWQTGSPALRQSLNIGNGDYDLTQFLIRNMGFVRLRLTDRIARITLYPRFLSREAYESLVHVLVSRDAQRTIIEDMGNPNRLDIIPDLEDAVARLGDLATVGGNVLRRDFYCERLNMQRLRGNPRLAPLASLLRRWRNTQGTLRGDLAAEFSDPTLRGRAIVMRMTSPQSGVYEYVGDGFPTFNATWRSSMLGRNPDGQPDPQYGHRTAEAYVQTHAAQAPRLEFVEAVIRVPGCLASRARYERLLLPWRRNGTQFVSVASVLRTSFPVAMLEA